MTIKGLRRLLSSYSLGRHHHHHHHDRPSSASSPASYPHTTPPPPLQQQQLIAGGVMKDDVAAIEAILAKWEPDDAAYAKSSSLFHGDRAEACEYLAAVRDLQRAMLSFVSSDASSESSSHAALIRAQTLMQTAMRRLEKEFYQILAANRHRLDPESVSARSSTHSSASDDAEYDDVRGARNSMGDVEGAAAIAMDDLHAIAETMISVGYGKECVKVYKVLRKSIVDEGLYRLGFERLSPSQVHKLDWQVLEPKIRSWLGASRVAVSTLFSGERVLSDHVFASSDSIREAVFADISGDAAVQFLRFPESVAKCKRSTEKMFRILDLCEAVSELLPEIEPVFSFVSTAAVRDQALSAYSKLAETARAILADFEAAIHKEHSKSLPPGGGIHPLTRHAMDYVITLADYEPTLAEIFADFPLHTQSSLSDFFDSSYSESRPSSPAFSSSISSIDDGHGSEIAVRFAWLILVLLCKLDGKAAAYRDAGLSYLFLANNLQYIVNKVRSSRLWGMLGEEWTARHAAKARQHAAGYERVAWGKVLALVTAEEVSPGEARDRMRAFNAALEEACTAQAGWVVADAEMREEVRAAVRGMLLPAYRGFYEQWRVVLEGSGAVRFSPEEVRDRLAELFDGSDDSGSGSCSSYRLGSDSGSVRSEPSPRPI
ncbi:exocyst complex component EXO70H1 [Musa acuminata AAA Group]|uniref:exocyst complex component EXO70H1 n=1 Tax=Musa acuminata AAA Group TaxID=214697 RepID=UPI0031DD8770